MKFLNLNEKNIIEITLNEMNKFHMFDYSENSLDSDKINIKIQTLSSNVRNSFYQFKREVSQNYSNYSFYKGLIDELNEKISKITQNAKNLASAFELTANNNLFSESTFIVELLELNLSKYCIFLNNIISILNKATMEINKYSKENNYISLNESNTPLIKTISSLEITLNSIKELSTPSEVFLTFTKDDLKNIDSLLLNDFEDIKEILDTIPEKKDSMRIDKRDFIFIFKHIEKRRNLITNFFNEISKSSLFDGYIYMQVFENEYKNLQEITTILKNFLFNSTSNYLLSNDKYILNYEGE